MPWLASPIGPYAGLGEQQGGRLVPDDGWYEAIERLVVSEKERRKLAKRATKWVAGETLTKNAPVWEARFAEAIERARAAAAVRSMRIAYAARVSSANGFYRGIGPMTALAQVLGHQVQRLPVEENQPTRDATLRKVDVLHIHRFCEERTLRLARAAKESGAAVVWDNDDDVGTLPKSVVNHREWAGYAWDRRLADMRRLFRFTDLVTTPSELLAERLRELGAPSVEVIENYVADHFARTPRPHRDGITIGWVAGLEHVMDVERLPIRDALQRLLDERPEVAVASIGLGLGLRSDRYHHIDVAQLHELPDYLSQFHIGIAPLADLTFNRARSNIKLKEYAAVGVPWLASPVGPYVGMGEKQGGRLVADDGWYEALELVKDKERRKLAKHAVKWGAGETLTKNARIWEAGSRGAPAGVGARGWGGEEAGRAAPTMRPYRNRLPLPTGLV